MDTERETERRHGKAGAFIGVIPLTAISTIVRRSNYGKKKEFTVEIKDVVLKLIGPVDPVGESNADDRSFENLKELCELTEQLVCIIDGVSYFNKDRAEYSMSRAGKYAFDFIYRRLNIKE